MNFQQLKYIIAVDENRHFGKAAKCCHVTQPTLSTNKKLSNKLKRESSCISNNSLTKS